jgi:hypothetical protein
MNNEVGGLHCKFCSMFRSRLMADENIVSHIC